jgi:hypothetical protein
MVYTSLLADAPRTPATALKRPVLSTNDKAILINFNSDLRFVTENFVEFFGT